MFVCCPRLHKGRSGRSSCRSNSRSRGTSRGPLYCTTPNDHRGHGLGGHQPMNVVLQTGRRPNQTRPTGQTRQTSSNGNKPKNFIGGHVRAKGLRAFFSLPALRQRRGKEGDISSEIYRHTHTHTHTQKDNKYKSGGWKMSENWASVVFHSFKKTGNMMSPCKHYPLSWTNIGLTDSSNICISKCAHLRHCDIW